MTCVDSPVCQVPVIAKHKRIFAAFSDNQRMNQAPNDVHPNANEPANAQKSRTGINRLLHATGYSLQGLRAGWGETAFRQEAIASVIMVPAAFWLGRTWVEVALLAGSVLFVMITELLNTGIETAIDRIGHEWHDLSKRAKDMGSAAVLLSVLLCVGVWLAALYTRFAA
jgi:diacylglycerol kinase (ATP)